jgi:hypothetical protein
MDQLPDISTIGELPCRTMLARITAVLREGRDLQFGTVIAANDRNERGWKQWKRRFADYTQIA